MDSGSLGEIISKMIILYIDNKEAISKKNIDSPEYNDYLKYLKKLDEFEETSKRELAAMTPRIARIDSQYQRTKSKPREY